MAGKQFTNPFRPGAGHMPPYLAGRTAETREFMRLLRQDVIMENLVLTGLRGTGKTVLLEIFKPLAIKESWLWVGTDLSESHSLSEERIAVRLMTDLAVVTAATVVHVREIAGMGFRPSRKKVKTALTFNLMLEVFKRTPGLVSDKLKQVLEFVWRSLKPQGACGIIFAYDEAQNLSDHAADREYPLSLLLDVFQSIQRKGIPFMLVLVGLPTLFPRLVEARTFAERMFRVVFLDHLNEPDSRDAIQKPIQDSRCPVRLDEKALQMILKESGGYPFFIQFFCREVYDLFLQKRDRGEKSTIPVPEITRKLDSDFFSGRWARATDRQRQLLRVVAQVKTSEREFSVQQVTKMSKNVPHKPFSASHVSQMLAALCDAGLIYRNRHGRYSFAVPLLGRFIMRQVPEDDFS